MTADRLRKIACDMEAPLARLAELDNLLTQMAELYPRPGRDSESQMYSLFQRNLGDDLGTVHKLWRDLFALVMKDKNKPPLKAVEE